jgi:hypothetical protein
LALHLRQITNHDLPLPTYLRQNPAREICHSLYGPARLAPYFAMLTLGTFNIWLRLKPDPYLLHLDLVHGVEGERPAKIPTGEVLRYIGTHANALLGLLAVAIGHVAMVSIMVMTPVHMAHVDVTLKVIGLVISVHIAGMYAFSPLVGQLSDRIGRIRVIIVGVTFLLLSGIIAGTSAANNSIQLGIGLFLLGLGWSCTLIAGSTLLTESISDDIRASVQGTSDTVMNLSAAIGGALAGVIIATLGYGWLCLIACIPVLALGAFATKQAVAE